MLDRRRFASLFGTMALASLAAPARISRAFAQGATPVVPRGNYLIKNGAVITVDPARGVLRADIHVNNGRIGAIRPDLAATGAEIIDASDMIAMPGFVDTHHHMWSSIGAASPPTADLAISRPRPRRRSSISPRIFTIA